MLGSTGIAEVAMITAPREVTNLLIESASRR